MSRLILIQEDDYERQYRDSTLYLHGKYHNQPTCLKNIHLTEEEDNMIGVHGGSDRHNQPRGNTPIGKLIR